MKTLISILLSVGSLVMLSGPAVAQNQLLSKDERKLVAKYDLSKVGYREIGRGFNMMSPVEEMELGSDMAEEIDANTSFITDPQLVDYVNQLGKRILQHSDTPMPMRFKIIDNDEINACALPNGVVYVNKGLLLAAANEAELAGVISHEIAHVAAHHTSRTSSKRQVLGFVNLGVTMLTGGMTQAISQPVMGIASQALALKFDRNAEREADLLGMQYQYLSGYDPGAFISFLERVSKNDAKQAKWLERMVATHPATSERIARAQRVIEVLLPPKADYILDTSEFVDARQRLAQLESTKLGLGLEQKPVLRRIQLQTTNFYAE